MHIFSYLSGILNLGPATESLGGRVFFFFLKKQTNKQLPDQMRIYGDGAGEVKVFFF